MSNNGGHNTIQYNLRWSEEMRDRIAAAAKENTRSMNQEIIARLEQSFEPSIPHETEMYLMETMIKEQQQQINQLIQALNRVVKND